MQKSFCDRFERVLKIIKTLRRLKSDAGNGSKITNIGHIYLQNDEIDFGITLESAKNICLLSKCKSLLIVYFDDKIPENGVIVYYNLEEDSTYVNEAFPNIRFEDIATSKSEQLFNLINTREFIYLPV
jgi:hypothetical protein